MNFIILKTLIMKKVMFFLSFVFLNIGVFSISGFCSSIIEGPPTKISILNSGGGGDERCEYSLVHSIQVANLELLHGNTECEGDLGEEYGLPVGYPDMNVVIRLNGEIVTIASVTSFTLASCAAPDGSHPSIYNFHHSFGINLSKHCREIDNILVLTAELQTNDSQPYPACDYTYPGGLFDCTFFEITSDFCYPNGSDGGPSDPENTGEICENVLETFILESYECTTCFETIPEPVPPPNGANDTRDENPKDNSLIQYDDEKFSFDVNPNPFSNNLHINWIDETVKTTISLFNVNGEVVKFISVSSYEKNEILKWDTTDLAKGVYFLHVENNKESKYMKLIKS
ncbi:MAG: hypothetical protein ACI9VN_003041 [Patescibacteria group bacterium]